MATQNRHRGCTGRPQVVRSRQRVANTTLGIPALTQTEGIHGLLVGNATIFNSPIGIACSWNPELVHEMAIIIARESQALGINQIFAPVVDLARELRFGRVEETYGEDAFLSGEMGYQYVKGIQSLNVSATAKHFAGFSAPEQGLNTGPVHGGERELRTTWLLPFKRAIIDAGAWNIMGAYHSYVLSLDGGGIRGLSSLFILENLMQKIEIIGDLDMEPLPCKYFDMICGTSTGGTIAVMLGGLRMSVSDCIKAYLEMSREVFGDPQSVTHREKFSPKALESVIKRIVKTRTGHENAPLMDRSACKTSAAPTFFPSLKFQENTGGEFIDAGVGCNNPTKALIKEAKCYYRLKRYNVSKPTCIFSIGTGQKDLIQLHKAASVFWFKDRTGLGIAPVLGDIVTDCENTHDDVTLSCIEENTADRYFRFNVPQGMQNIVLDELGKGG
ncbi:hypothetical protein NX059_012342 [Plenodomus lindquistii]|nr:hypothetical protein NX059_012342 [Plenodomus lindquistii]